MVEMRTDVSIQVRNEVLERKMAVTFRMMDEK